MKHEIFITSVFLLSHSDMSNSFETPWSVARKAPLSMGNLQARTLSGLPCLPSGDLPNPEIKPRSPTLQTDPGKPSPLIWKASSICMSLLPVQFSSVPQVVWLFETPWTEAREAFQQQVLELTQTHVHQVTDAISSSLIPFSSSLQSFPESGSFPMSQFLASGGQSNGSGQNSTRFTEGSGHV